MAVSIKQPTRDTEGGDNDVNCKSDAGFFPHITSGSLIAWLSNRKFHRYAVHLRIAADRGLRSRGSLHPRLLLFCCYVALLSWQCLRELRYFSFDRPGNSDGRQPVHFLNVLEKTKGF
jgi:hypothetical protein